MTGKFEEKSEELKKTQIDLGQTREELKFVTEEFARTIKENSEEISTLKAKIKDLEKQLG